MEYVLYLVENEFLKGVEAGEAIAWAEDRREELKLKKTEIDDTSAEGDENLMKTVSSILELLSDVVLLLKILVGLVALFSFVLFGKK